MICNRRMGQFPFMDQEFLERSVAILGYGIEGQAVFQYLLSHGKHDVVICDKSTEIDFEFFKQRRVGSDYLDDLSRFDLIFRSPGIPPFLPEIEQAKKNGSEVSSLTKLFFDNCKAPIIGVTGSNGKTTTAMLIAHVIRENINSLPFKKVWEGGNNDCCEPLLCRLDQIHAKDIVVLELSSFQLYDLEVSPHIAVITNFSPNHLDWHKSLDDYANAKSNIFRHQKSGDYVLLNTSNGSAQVFAKYKTMGKALHHKDVPWQSSELPYLTHNENISAAYTIASLFGLNTEQIKRAFLSFKLPTQRLELVAKIDGVSYYNDSASTTPESVACDLSLCKQAGKDVVLIAGGKNKGMSYKSIIDAVKEHRPKSVLLIGTVAGSLASEIEQTVPGQSVKILTGPETAINEARGLTTSGDIVLFSPGFTSFDMFKNSKERGKIFTKLVNQLSPVLSV